MTVWHVTDQDRDERGRIRLLSDLLPPVAEEEHTAPERTRWSFGRLELAGIVVGFVLTAALIAGLNTFWPATPPKLARPTAAPAHTMAPTAALTWAAVPTSTPARTSTPEPPTEAPPTHEAESQEPSLPFIETMSMNRNNVGHTIRCLSSAGSATQKTYPEDTWARSEAANNVDRETIYRGWLDRFSKGRRVKNKRDTFRHIIPENKGGSIGYLLRKAE